MLTEPKFFEEFEAAFCHSGSIVIDCECGITHVATDDIEYLEEDEIFELKELKRKHPEKIVEWSCSMISWTIINGKQVVFGCPCGRAEELCFFIENHHQEIMKLIEKIVKSERSEIEAKEELLQKAQGVK